tara:strand:- start:4 stop:468 length:465 start_codon:yes stop_codon:yes gene_type:complete
VAVDPLTDDQAIALAFYIRAFRREQKHASLRDLADVCGGSVERARRLTDALHSKRYVYVMDGRVASILREVGGARVKVHLLTDVEGRRDGRDEAEVVRRYEEANVQAVGMFFNLETCRSVHGIVFRLSNQRTGDEETFGSLQAVEDRLDEERGE